MTVRMVRGSCYCGAVQIEVEPPAEEVGHCHCANCRRAFGTGIYSYAWFPDEQVRVVSGDEHLTRHVNDLGRQRRFCKICGTTMLYSTPRYPGTSVNLACLLDSLGQLPDRHVYADRAPDWLPITDELLRLGGESGEEPLA